MDTNETLFSLEVHVESVNQLKVSCIIPAVSFRLLDFPSLVIHLVSPVKVQNLREKSQIQDITRDVIEAEFRDRYGNISFTKGKSCLFSANIVNLQSQLQSTPLYVMLLDVWHKKPKLVGSAMIPLKKTIDKLSADVEKLGISAPSISQQQGTYDVYNLMGTVVGNVQLCVRILSLGGCLTPHIPAQSIMTRPPEKQQQQNEDKVEDNVILEDLEVIDEENIGEEQVLPTSQSVAVQANFNVVTKPKTSKYTSLPYVKDNENEPAIIANTVCPPPLYYHVLSHRENSGKRVEVREPKVSSCSPNTAYDVDFVYYNPNLVQPDGSCGCASVCVQTDNRPDLPMYVHEEKAIDSSDKVPTTIDSKDLPLLTALLEELSFLRNQRKGDTKVAAPRKVFPAEPQPQQREREEIKLRECCSKLIKEKTRETKKKRPKTAVLSQKRVKFKQTSLQYGMTKTQLMRLEMNQKGKKLPSNSKVVAFKEDERRVPNGGKKPSNSSKGLDLGRKQTVFPSAANDEQIQEVLSTVMHEEEKDPEVIDNKEEDHCNDSMRTDSVDSSSRAVSSPTSVEIFLPQMEGDSDIGSDIFDTTALDNDNRFAPHATYNKYGHTGIPEEQHQSGETPELKETLKDMINQSELAKESFNQSEQTGKEASQLGLTYKSLHQSDSNKTSGQSESANKSPDQSETNNSKPSPPSPRKMPDLTRQQSMTPQTARSRASTALSMYSDDFEECQVWDTPQTTDNESSASSSTSYHSANSQTSHHQKKHYTEPVKSYYSPLKSKDFNKRSSRNSTTSEEASLTKNQSFDTCTLDSKEQFQDSLNSHSKEVITDSDNEKEHKSVLHLPKPINDMGYTF